jgi:hypothetical protein
VGVACGEEVQELSGSDVGVALCLQQY